MFRKNSFSIQINKRIFIPRVASIIAMVIAMVLSGCISSSSAADEAFEEKYDAAKKKYDKYIHEPVSGQEVLDLIDNWDETDFELIIESSEGHICRVSNWDKNDTLNKYRDKESIYYVDPNALYEGTFHLYQFPRKHERKIADLDLSLVKDPSSSDDTASKDLNRYAWEDFKEKISEEEYYALIKYIPLFDENKEFYCFPLEKKCSLQSLKTLFEVDNYWVWDFSLIDMDGNEEMEIVITTSLGPGITFVISEIDDEYYGSYYSSREMSNLQKNGTFVGSGSASNQKFSKLSITKEGFETRIFEEKSGWGDESNWTEDYYEQFMEENYSDPIEWNRLNLEIR